MLTTAIELLAMRVWYRSLAGIQRMCSGPPPPRVPATRSSPATRLPQEIAEMIISHLIYDKPSLLACSLTCHSWYIAAVPHLHHTVSVVNSVRSTKRARPQPLLYMYRLGFLFLVKKLRIREGHFLDPYGFSQDGSISVSYLDSSH